jgi:peptide/nickel transport system substrate-binding protein
VKRGWVILLAGVVYLFSTGGSQAGQTGGIPPGRVLKFAVHTSALGHLDPHYARGSQDFTYADMVFNSLIRYLPGDLSRLEPDLAEAIPEFEIRDGRQVWTIYLKKGIFFHPGPFTPAYALTADDVIFSLKKAADPARSTICRGICRHDL